MPDKKIKVITISDHPMLPSGVGTQTKYVIEALLETKKFQVFSLGGAMKHPNYNLMKVSDDWHILPVDGYGDKSKVLSIIKEFNADILYFMTDPRYYEWLWQAEDDIRQIVPMVYYHVWDNYPYPLYNKRWYESNDCIASISKVTSDIVQTVAPEVDEKYIPHAVPMEIFKKAPEHKIEEVRKNNPALKDKLVFFWNNRNARRKQSGTLVYWYKKFLDQDHVDNTKVALLMHTDPTDPNGQPLEHLATELGMVNSEIIFSKGGIPAEDLALMYGLADCTINISDAEGFGLATLESLSCETPIIVNMTGGLQEQVTDGENWFGVGIEPASKAIIGSQTVPYIYEDRISESDFIDAMNKIYAMTAEERENLGKLGREHIEKNYNFKDFKQSWVDLMTTVHEKFGSWDDRKLYKPWRLEKI